MRVGGVRNYIWLLLVFLCVFSFSLNLIVIAYDHVGDVYDTMHLERTGRLLAHAVQGENDAWPAFRGAVAGSAYPPLIHYLSLPVRLVVGDHPRAGAVTVAAWSLLTILATFGIGHLLAGDRAGLLAAFFITFAPGFYRFARLETTDAPLAAMVALTMFFLLRSDGLGRRAGAMQFGAVAALGMLTKQSFMLYLILPSSYLIVQYLWAAKPEKRKVRLRNAAWSSGIFLAIVFMLYLPGLESWITTRQVVRAFYLAVDQIGFVDNLKLLISTGLGPFLTVLTILGFILVSKAEWANRALFLWFVPPILLLHAVFGMQSTRYLLPLLPAGAILGALGVEKWLIETGRKRAVAGVLVVFFVLGGAAAYDNLRAEQTPFSFRDFEKRQHIEGLPRPERLGWSVQPIASKMAAGAANKKFVMLLDSPYTSLLQGELWLADPRLDIDNLFERAAAGRTPPEFEPDGSLVEYLRAADVILVKSGFNTDTRNFNWAQDVNRKFAQRVFKAFFEVKGEFELVDHFPYPESTSPVLLYRKKQRTSRVIPSFPGPTPPAPHSGPAPETSGS
ncbi:MAG: glycosyltransferase family 39 protein [Candidatus Lernaella stagnicola]|nr:glycosyltransferase family 39 protein [Candidatus Lernaella stagnicola]